MEEITLEIDDDALENAEQYARRHETSVEELVIRFLATLNGHSPKDREKKGIARGHADE